MGAGRPSKFTKALCRKILRLVREGVAPTRAAKVAGIHKDTLRTWLRQGEAEEEGEYYNFFASMEKAKEDENTEAEKCLRKAFTGTKETTSRKKYEKSPLTNRMIVVEETKTVVTKIYPQYALSWLERRDRAEWAPPKPAETIETPPDEVTAGPKYSDEWLETDDE